RRAGSEASRRAENHRHRAIRDRASSHVWVCAWLVHRRAAAARLLARLDWVRGVGRADRLARGQRRERVACGFGGLRRLHNARALSVRAWRLVTIFSERVIAL